jgi:hypothetical protein
MSQQRSCCCNPEQEFGLACLHSDKLNPNSESNYKRKDYQAGWNPSTYSPNIPPINYYRTGQYSLSPDYNSQGMNDFGGYSSFVPQGYRQGVNGTIDAPETTGQGCMLCHGSLIMSFKPQSYRRGGTVGDNQSCNFEQGCSTQVTRYSSTVSVRPAEETMHVLYLAVKDVWYFERGPSGVPFSWMDATMPPTFLPKVLDPDGIMQAWTQNQRLGKRDNPSPIVDCARQGKIFPPIPTDADRLCHPELSYCTNPANVFFTYGDAPVTPIGGGQAMKDAYATIQGPGFENTDPELANYFARGSGVGQGDSDRGQGWQEGSAQNYVCSQLESNTHPWADGSMGFPENLGSPCFGIYQPGFSSWQMYQMRKDPALRHLGDTVTYGNGLRVFRSPGEALTEQGDLPSNRNLYTNAYGSLMGTLYRARIWVKADKYVNSDYRFPCNDSSGRTVAYHPPQTNDKMKKHWSSGGYPNMTKTCASGPAILIYTCSGVPVYSSDLRDEYLKGNITANMVDKLSDFYEGNFTEGTVDGIDSSQAYYECFVLPQIEQALGETGRFVAKDWRADQIEKYSTLENEFEIIAAEANEGDADFQVAQQYAQGIPLPPEIKEYLIPKEVEDDEGNVFIEENELLPVQKYGPQFLTFMINRARPKQRGLDETGTDELLTEMPYYQASAFTGSNFKIDSYDPWHPQNTGAIWPLLGRRRQELFPITFGLPDGVESQFEFRYPIRDAYVNAYPTLNFDDDNVWRQIVPEWEEKLFESWYKNNPIYFHACSGGWSFSGMGDRHTPRSADGIAGFPSAQESCRWGNNLYQLDRLDSIHQLGRNLAPYSFTQAIIPYPWSLDRVKWTGLANYSICDGFPNFVWAQNTPDGQGTYWNISAQPRNRPSKRSCHTVNDVCAPPGCVQYCPSADDCDGASPCCCPGGEEQGPPGLGGRANCNCRGLASASGGILRNCCSLSSPPYSGRKAEGGLPIGRATAAISTAQPTSVSTRSSDLEITSWNRNHPETKMGDSSFYGIRCSESGGCPIGYKCCCPAGCDGDCFCVPENNDCETPPCTSQSGFNGPCCQSFGSCCYEENGELKCVDNITEEECITKKSLGGRDGIFNKDSECSVGQCPTTTVRGACFYTDKLLDHQICRQTTEQACAGLSGEFHANQKCSEFPDKKTTGYEDISGMVGTKPEAAGDRTCGRYGYAVNCCTEEIDEDTGEFVRKCEVKCISDCDISSGSSRIVSSCESCGELGHCCTKDAYCRPNVTEADCFGTWSPGPDCDAESCINTGNFDTDYDNDLIYERKGDQSGPGDEDPREGEGLGSRPPQSPFEDLFDEGVCTTCQDFIGFGPVTDVCVTGYSNRFVIAGKYNPTMQGTDPPTPLTGCKVSNNPILSHGCVTRSIQVTKIGFRHVVFTSLQDTSGSHLEPGVPGGRCPANFGGNAGGLEDRCCDGICNPSVFSTVNCSTPEDSRSRIHEPIHTMEVTVYPYKIRCQQVRDSAGFWACGLLAEQLNPSETTDYAVGIAGISDFLTCHEVKKRYRNVETVEIIDECAEGSSSCDGQGSCIGPVYGTGITVTIENAVSGTGQVDFDVNFSAGAGTHIGGFCPSLTNNLVRAYSIPFPGASNTIHHIYAPSNGVPAIPKSHCHTSGNARPLDRSPRQVPAGTLADCAEFYNDKLLQDVDLFVAPPPYEELIFHDYGGLTGGDISHWMCQTDLEDANANWFRGASAEYVDAFFDDSKNPNEFWIKKQFPELQSIRLFGVGCYNIPGSFEGGRGHTLEIDGVTYSAGGDFAGTMVLSFGSTSEFQRFDETYGSENLQLTFESAVPNQPERESMGGNSQFRYKFVAQPSFNINKGGDFGGCTDADDDTSCRPIGDAEDSSQGQCSYSNIGFLNGRGLTYSNVENGLTGDYNGKVYEFCSYLNVNQPPDPTPNPGDDNGLGGQLKPIFILPGDEIPLYSGVRGPVVLYARNEDGEDEYDMRVTLKRFDLVENDQCGVCYDEQGNLITDGTIAIKRTRDECLEPDPSGAPTTSNQFFPGVSGITTGGALGCCTHLAEDPLGVFEEKPPSVTPCNSWQEKGDTTHDNPARTFGNGDCACEQP